MILEALQTILNPIAQAHPLIGDIAAVPPFIVYKAKPTIQNTKDGLSGHIHTVNVAVIAETISALVALSNSVRSTMLQAAGTIAGTAIEAILLTDNSLPYEEILDGNILYVNDLEFKIFSTNE